ncbi:MAG TPA: DUF4236 domain-containing protein [Candidatus Anoxymicrobiaceae bacterium]
MGFRLQRRVTIAPGLTMNISKRGVGFSAGPRGAKVSIGPRGTRESLGIPGTGMRYEVRQDRKKAPARQASGGAPRPQVPAPAPPPAATIGFLEKAFKQPYEKKFIGGAQRMLAGDQAGALAEFQASAEMNPGCADAELLAALMSVNLQDYPTAQACLERVISWGAASFPLVLAYMGTDSVSFELALTDEVKAVLHFDIRAAYLTLAEIYQHQGRQKDAVALLQQAIARCLRGPLLVLSLAELYNELEMDDELIAITQGVENQDDVTLATLFYLGQAMTRKGYYESAVMVLKAALARKKDRSEALLLETRYVLALTYEESGKKSLARKQYEQILAKDFAFRDARERADRLAPAAAPSAEA